MGRDTGETRRERRMKRGIGVSPGVVIGPAYVLFAESLNVVERTLKPDEVDREIIRLEEALIETRRQIKAIQQDIESRTTHRDASVLDAHLMVLDDRMFIDEVVEKIRNDRLNVEAAVMAVGESYANLLASVEDDYLRERVADVRDVARRLVRSLDASLRADLVDLKQRHIVVARDLAPSETASLRRDMVIGFVTDLGSPTSHTAVMARALTIPAVVGLSDITEQVHTGDELLVDGNKGVIIVNPSDEELQEYGRLAREREAITRGLTSLQHEPAETRDGHRRPMVCVAPGPEGDP